MLEEKVREEPLNDNNQSQEAPYDRLRSLLLGQDYESALRKQISKSDVERVAAVLTEAFHRRGEKDDTLAEELSPIIESAIDTSIKQNPSRITNVIFPIMGPAVRKAVASALSDMVRSLNHLLQESVTARAWIWRFKAWRAGIPYPQYVILQTLVYRVEQVFFIHKDSGLLLESASAAGIEYQDPDLVSSMLSAINDFVKDSFSDEQAGISTIQFGELNLIVESGPHAVIAMAIRGSYPSDIHATAQSLLELLHQEYADNLESFNGDLGEFTSCKELLVNALIERKKNNELKRPWLVLSVLSIALLGIGAYWLNQIQINRSVNEYIQKIKKESGYQLISYVFDEGKLSASIFRAPTAKSTIQFISDNPVKNFGVELNSTHALIADPNLFIPLLSEKYGVKVEIENTPKNSNAIIIGEISKSQYDSLRNDPILHSIFPEHDLSKLKILSPISDIQIARQELEDTLNQIRQDYLLFEVASTNLVPKSKNHLATQISRLLTLSKLAERANASILQISVEGFADAQGKSNDNQALSEARAKYIAENLIANGISESLIVTWGVGTKDAKNLPPEIQRRVSINVLYQYGELK